MNNLISQEEKNAIDKICNQERITNYTITRDDSNNVIIDVDGDVELRGVQLTVLPLKFGKVSGHFDCSKNSLSSLDGCPTSVGGDFSCFANTLASLEHCPRLVGGSFFCSINKISSLEFFPDKVGADINCSHNLLTSLEGCPDIVNGSFFCTTNRLTSLEYCPTVIANRCRFELNSFPLIFSYCLKKLSDEERLIFVKYQNDYEVWAPEFTEENMQLLLDDIKDGLQ